MTYRFAVPANRKSGSSSVGRASASQAEGREFEPRLPLKMTPSDEQILKTRLASGDSDAFAAIFRQFYKRAYLFLKSFTRGGQDIAKDLAQDVFLKVWENRKRMVSVDSLDAFIFTMTRNAAFDYFRKAYRRDKSLEDMLDGYLLNQLDASSDIETITHNRLSLSDVRKSLESLPQQRRDIFLLSRFMGVENSDIARMLNISRKTVENQISLANQDLRRGSLS